MLQALKQRLGEGDEETLAGEEPASIVWSTARFDGQDDFVLPEMRVLAQGTYA